MLAVGFLRSQRRAPGRIVLDIDATDVTAVRRGVSSTAITDCYPPRGFPFVRSASDRRLLGGGGRVGASDSPGIEQNGLAGFLRNRPAVIRAIFLKRCGRPSIRASSHFWTRRAHLLRPGDDGEPASTRRLPPLRHEHSPFGSRLGAVTPFSPPPLPVRGGRANRRDSTGRNLIVSGPGSTAKATDGSTEERRPGLGLPPSPPGHEPGGSGRRPGGGGREGIRGGVSETARRKNEDPASGSLPPPPVMSPEGPAVGREGGGGEGGVSDLSQLLEDPGDAGPVQGPAADVLPADVSSLVQNEGGRGGHEGSGVIRLVKIRQLKAGDHGKRQPQINRGLKGEAPALCCDGDHLRAERPEILMVRLERAKPVGGGCGKRSPIENQDDFLLPPELRERNPFPFDRPALEGPDGFFRRGGPEYPLRREPRRGEEHDNDEPPEFP